MKTYPQAGFNHLPTKVGQKDFNKYILPYLSMGKRGPDTKISKYKIFNYILHVLHTGTQWDELVIYKNEIHWSNIYRWHNRWSKDGSYQAVFESSVAELYDAGKLDLSVLHIDGSNTVAKKGARDWDILGINIKREIKCWLFVMEIAISWLRWKSNQSIIMIRHSLMNLLAIYWN